MEDNKNNELFELAGGTVQGRDHRNAARNNQDAWAIAQDEDWFVAVVADGCGSSSHSEVGAKLGVRMTVAVMSELVERPTGIIHFEFARRRIESRLRLALRSIEGNTYNVSNVADFFLFTLVGVVANRRQAYFFMAGDGTLGINGEYSRTESKNNQPAYLGYNLTLSKELFGWNHAHGFTLDDVNDFVLATDGVDDLQKAAGSFIPGSTSQIVPSLDEMVATDGYYQNPVALSRTLTLVNRDHIRLNREEGELIKSHGHLHDDTTLIVGRRRAKNG